MDDEFGIFEARRIVSAHYHAEPPTNDILAPENNNSQKEEHMTTTTASEQIPEPPEATPEPVQLESGTRGEKARVSKTMIMGKLKANPLLTYDELEKAGNEVGLSFNAAAVAWCKRKLGLLNIQADWGKIKTCEEARRAGLLSAVDAARHVGSWGGKKFTYNQLNHYREHDGVRVACTVKSEKNTFYFYSKADLDEAKRSNFAAKKGPFKAAQPKAKPASKASTPALPASDESIELATDPLEPKVYVPLAEEVLNPILLEKKRKGAKTTDASMLVFRSYAYFFNAPFLGRIFPMMKDRVAHVQRLFDNLEEYGNSMRRFPDKDGTVKPYPVWQTVVWAGHWAVANRKLFESSPEVAKRKMTEKMKERYNSWIKLSGKNADRIDGFGATQIFLMGHEPQRDQQRERRIAAVESHAGVVAAAEPAIHAAPAPADTTDTVEFVKSLLRRTRNGCFTETQDGLVYEISGLQNISIITKQA